MSNSLAIATVTATLANILDAAIKGASDAMKGDGPIEVKTGRPTPDASQLPTKGVNVFLYQVVPSAALRNLDLPTRRADGSLAQRPQIALDLHYLLSFHGEEKALQPQRLLGIVLRTLHARPLLSRAAIEKTTTTFQTDPNFQFMVAADLANSLENVRFSPLSLSLEEMSKVWSVFFQTPYSLSLAYQASPILIEPDDAPSLAPPVRSRSIVAVAGGAPIAERVLAAGAAELPITPGSVVRVEGRGFGGEGTIVRIDGAAVMPDLIADDGLRVRLPLSLWPGVHGLVVALAAPAVTPFARSFGAESSVVPFVLHPRLVAASASSLVTTGAGPAATHAGDLQLDFASEVGRDQRVVLSLDEESGGAPVHRHAFEAAPRPHAPADPLATTRVHVAFQGVPAGRYTVRARIDGTAAVLADGAPPLTLVLT